jgi:tRNA(fMet)-specific endonuclease VapC
VDPILLDTNAYSAFRRGDPEGKAVLQQAPAVFVCAIVHGELLGGFAAGNREQKNRSELIAFLGTPRVSVVSVDAGTAEHYASLYVALKRSGTPIPTNDLWIAATAMQHGLRLYTLDAHFRVVPGLRFGDSVANLTAP